MYIYIHVYIYICVYIYILVGGFNHPEKYEFVNGKDYSIYYGNKICLKPPTSIDICV